MANTAILAIKIIADASQAQRGLEQTAGSVEKAQSSLGKMVKPAALALGAVAAFGAASVKSASDAEQAMGALEAVFGKNAAAAKKNANNAAASTGLAASQYGNLAAVLGAQLKTMGTASDELVPKTDQLISLGADLAATFGGTTSDAVEAVSSLLRGERDPIEKYGVSIKQADINARLAAKGLDKLEGSAKTQAEAQAALELLTRQTADAQGQFARESDSAAGASQIAAAQYENTKAALGKALLPAVVAVMGALASLAGFFQQHIGLTQVLIGIIGGLAATILVANAALKAITLSERVLGITTAETTGMTIAQRIATVANTAAQKAAEIATKAWAVAQRALNLVLAANPIGLVIAAVIGLAAVIVTAYRQSETFRRIVDASFDAVKDAAAACWGWIKEHWPLLLAVITGPIGAAVIVVTRHWGDIKEGAQGVLAWLRGAWDAISGILTAPFQSAWSTISGIIDKIRSAVSSISRAIESIPKPKIPDLNPFTAAYTPAPAGPSTRAPTNSTAGGGSAGGGPTIVIQGALDPEGVARQVERLLRQHGTRTGRLATVAPRLSL